MLTVLFDSKFEKKGSILDDNNVNIMSALLGMSCNVLSNVPSNSFNLLQFIITELMYHNSTVLEVRILIIGTSHRSLSCKEIMSVCSSDIQTWSLYDINNFNRGPAEKLSRL